MTSATAAHAAPQPKPKSHETPPTFAYSLMRTLRLVLIVGLILVGLAVLLQEVIHPLVAAGGVNENFTTSVASLLIGLLPFGVYLAAGVGARPLRKNAFMGALLMAWLIAVLAYSALVLYQYMGQTGPFNAAPSLGFSMRQIETGIEVTSIDAGGAAEEAGLLVGDVITALRRDVLTADELQTVISHAAIDDAMRFRLLRAGEEMQLTVRMRLANQVNTTALLIGLATALITSTFALLIPARFVPHALLIISLLPLLAGYYWLILASFSERTEGLLPVDAAGNVGGLTLSNWDFLTSNSIGGPTANIWMVTLNSFMIAVVMTISSLVVCSMTGYALSRMNFPGRRAILSMTLILHGFPAVTLLIPIFLVLINLGNLPVIGKLIGYNTTGGVALVMIAFELPLGAWLMKGFFDNISWDMERSGLIDGASRFRVFWEIIVPQIRPGLMALGIFSFIGGWNAYLIPATYTVGTGLANLPVYIRQITGELTPVNWNQVASVGMFQLIPIFIFFLFAQEYLLNIYAGGTKGSA
jgi:inositol-phosphate transport system permease protein